MALQSLTVGLLFDLSLPPYLGAPLRHLGPPPPERGVCLDFFESILNRGFRGLTLNVNGWLCQHWLEQGGFACLDRLQSLLRYGLVEMTGTAAHHPILPLLQPIEARRQVVLNTAMQKRLLIEDWQPAGLFPPELAYGHELVPLLPALGLRWCLSDDANFASLHGFVPYDWVAQVGGLSVLLRSRHWSQVVASPGTLPGHFVAEEMVRSCGQWFDQGRGYIILAVPGMSLMQSGYREFLWSFLGRLQADPAVKLAHLSQIVDEFPSRDFEVPPGSWKSSVDDFWNGDFFAPWNSPHQSKHQILWRLTELAWASLERLREKMDLGMNSDNFEWVSLEAPPPQSLKFLLEVIQAGQPEQVQQAQLWMRFLEG